MRRLNRWDGLRRGEWRRDVSLRNRAKGSGKPRRCQVEPLESRELLSVSVGDEGYWLRLAAAPPQASETSVVSRLGAYDLYHLDLQSLSNRWAAAPAENSVAPLVVSLPGPGGQFERFAIVDSAVMEPELAAAFPQIQAFAGVGLDDPTASLRADVTPEGFHAQVLSPRGRYYIDPADGTTTYALYQPEDYQSVEAVDETVLPGSGSALTQADSPAAAASAPTHHTSGDMLRTVRIAVAATGEYTQYHGGTLAGGMAAVTTAVNRIDGIFEQELAIRLQLVTREQFVIFTDPATDPFTDGTNLDQTVTENQDVIDRNVGDANYDVGHVFSAAGGGGVVFELGSVGQSGIKAQGGTNSANPIGDAYYIDYVAHELGHQFGAEHTWNSPLNPPQWAETSAMEPGSGSTIMGYAGIMGADDLQAHSDPYFHSQSYEEILANLERVDALTPRGVGTITPTGNQIPLVNAGADYTIPARTPFVLTATGNDADRDPITYCWEERDLGPAQSLAAPDNGTSPLFRSWLPTTDPSRTFPRMQDLLNNTRAPGEELPTMQRTMNFRVTVRDNRVGAGGVNSDDMQIQVIDTGAAFAVTSPNTPVAWKQGEQRTITWNTAGTEGRLINAQQVKISLSIDGGVTFPYVLSEATANDGSESVRIPLVGNTNTARIKVEAVGNIFFDVSNTNFSIGDLWNHAPTMDTSAALALLPQAEDDPAAAGTRVADLLANSWVDIIRDVDAGAQEGIGIFAADSAHGSFQYSLDNGSTWRPVGEVSAAQTLCLASDSATRLRFVPAPNYNGTIDPVISFRAWDRADGTPNGGSADTQSLTLDSAFSAESETASITITAVDDPPQRLAGTIQPLVVNENTPPVPLGTAGLSYGPGAPDEYEFLDYIVQEVPATLGQIVMGDGSTVAAHQSLTLDEINNLRFVPAQNRSGGPEWFRFTVVETGVPLPLSLLQELPITIRGINEPPIRSAGTIPNPFRMNEDGGLTSLGLGDLAYEPGRSADEAAQLLTYEIISLPAPSLGQLMLNGVPVTATGVVQLDDIRQLAFLPQADASGQTEFRFTVTDEAWIDGQIDHQQIEEVVPIVVQFVNDPPVAAPDAVAAIENLTQVWPAQTLLANDAAGPANESQQGFSLIRVEATAETHGAVSFSGGNVQYVPDANFAGTARFNYWIEDGGTPAVRAMGIVTVQVAEVNAPPSVVGIVPAPRIPQDSPAASLGLDALSFQPGPGEADQTLSYRVATVPDPTLGTVLLADGQTTVRPGAYTWQQIQGMMFRPLPGASGSGGLQISATDNGTTSGRPDPLTALATVSITVTPAQTRPATGDMPGLYAPDTALFFLRDQQSGGPADHQFDYGPNNLGWIPLTGDWDGDGRATAGLYNPANGIFYLRNQHAGGAADITFLFGLGGLGWQPLVGDWNGDGRDTVAVYDPTGKILFLKNEHSGGNADQMVAFDPAGGQILVGDWDGDGRDTLGVYWTTTGIFALQNSFEPGTPLTQFQFGVGGAGWVGLAGDWNADGRDTVGVYVPDRAIFYLRNVLDGGDADRDFVYGIGSAGWRPLVGSWQGAASPAPAPAASPAADAVDRVDLAAIAQWESHLAADEDGLELLARGRSRRRI